MSAKIYWNLVVIFGVLYQGIIGTLGGKDIDESPELLVRQKRVINRAPGEDRRDQIKRVPYIVSLKRYRTSESCAGVILKPSVVLTATQCVPHEVREYRVYSGSARIFISPAQTLVHNVTEKRRLLGNFPQRLTDGIALLTVFPTFIYSVNTRNIDLYHGNIQPGSYGTVSGWGCLSGGNPGTAHSHFLRSIIVPIITNQVCTSLYRNPHFPISATDICTLDPRGLQHCGVNDAGAPLVIAVNNNPYLVGIHLHNVAGSGRTLPDVFANLQASMYKSWIQENIHSM